MIHDFHSCAVRTSEGVLLRMSGMLPTPAHRIDVTGYYPGTIFPIVDPGYAFVHLATRVKPGRTMQVLVPWESSLPLKSDHSEVRVILDGHPIGTSHVEPGFVVAALTGGTGSGGELHIFSADQPILGIYTVVYGPAARAWCEVYVRSHSSGLQWDGNLPWTGILRSPADMMMSGGGGTERPWPLRTGSGPGSERPWPLLKGEGGEGPERPWPLRSLGVNSTGFAVEECELADADWIAASQSGETLTVLSRVWVPSDAWHAHLVRSMLTVEPPGFALTRCRVGPERPMKMVLVDLRQSFVIGVARETVKIATREGVKEVKVVQSPERASEIAVASSAPTASTCRPSRTAIGRSKAFKFDEAHAAALKELDANCQPSAPFSTTRVVAIGTESGGITGASAMYVVVERVL